MTEGFVADGPSGGMSKTTEDTVRSAMQEVKTEQESHGHSWDISDVMAALRQVGIETHDEIALLVRELHRSGIIELDIRPRVDRLRDAAH